LPHTASREARRARRWERYEQVVELYGAGMSLTAIAQHVGLARATIRKYVHADGFPEWPPRRTQLHAGSVQMTYLRTRWAAGCHAEEGLTVTDHHLSAHLLAPNEAIRTTHELIAGFRHLLCTRGHGQFTTWQEAAQASEIPEVRGFLASLLRDEDAVRAALTED